MKSTLKKILFFLAYVLHPNRSSKVVYYHDVSKKYTDMGTEINLIKRHLNIIQLSGFDIVPSINAKQGQVMICFDDGWAGLYDYKDFFVQQNIKPTVFIAVDLIGKKGYLTKEQIIELQNVGFKFESHTWSHEDLTIYNEKDLEHQLKDSKQFLEKEFNLPFDAICYPRGRFSEKIMGLCNKYGYKKQFSSIPGGYYDLAEKGIICRNCAQFSTPQELKWMLMSTSYVFSKKLIRQQVER